MNSNNAAPSGTNQPTGQLVDQRGFPVTNTQASGVVNTGATNPGGFTNPNAIGGNQPQIGRGQTLASTPAEPPAWMPLILCVLGLAGSLAANLYLGVSYLDARQKYQSLVRKTADTFRRVKAVAA
jgi:hypothetical protein